jgi:glycosyltransferase involved in cell wall biosynthesis
MLPLVSIIVPVFNVEPYLRRCLDSVCLQTLRDIEVICVNDCSPDNSAEILSEYANQDSRFKLFIHSHNRGLSAARNTGLKIAVGRYVYFLDSDDWMAVDYIEKMFAIADKHNLAAVCNTNVWQVNTDGTYKKLLKRSFPEGRKDYTVSCIMAWTWLLKKNFLDTFEVIFPEGLIHEDYYFFYTVIRSLGQIYIINSSPYYHFENPDSIMGCAQNRIIKGCDSIHVVEKIYEYYKNNALLDQYNIPFFYLLKYCLNRNIDRNTYFQQLQLFYCRIKEDVFSNNHLYTKFELDFFNDVLRYDSYKTFCHLDYSLIDTLRRRVKNAKSH